MNQGLQRFLARIFVSLTLTVISLNAYASCNAVSPTGTPLNQPYTLKIGLQRLTLECDISAPVILSFTRDHITYSQLYTQDLISVEALTGSRKAFFIPQGRHTFYLDLSAQVPAPFAPSVQSVAQYQRFSTVHTLTLSGFVGFCLALTLYVGMLGNSVRNMGFYSYSFYILSAAIFFTLQEGLFNIGFEDLSVLNSVHLHLFFVGVTVFAAVRFLDQLLDLKVLLRQWQRNLLLYLSYIALGLAFLQLPFRFNAAVLVNMGFSVVTLLIMAIVLAAAIYAVVRKVHCSRLVLAGLSIVVLAMLARFTLDNISPFLQRYGLIIGITIEAFIFAIATAKKVKKLDEDRLTAYRKASMDTLCSVMNRSGWEGFAKELVDTHKREGGYLTVLFVDVDNFKRINDKYGHNAGDTVLQVIAKIVTNRCREQDAVGRIGGDEFVILSHCFSEGQSQRLAERIIKGLEGRDVKTANCLVPVSASVGVFITSEPSVKLDTLIQQADANMYKAKERRRRKK
ncbi:sensor domain-containing diguanylate cyclase [Alteromonas australica]|jgi:diguanylate cyclase (GGDEF)-like protein|uniref:Diguanylate cyclase n=2 Tax=Alteromonas australica TaxID=589873 RepID=A0A358DZL4_9ALTE|nr:diguanylate cyclase [Alteromonas australica]MAF70108.1 diguanylate cyclase [Alteromonas sp.]MBU32960.1 diguanylate cyclase [Alteromonas sp.]HAI70741.1 diguanylate cyclase [Alteromonas australica]HBU51721.1 diguanylate cyclase [Alteromonas australica]|tara:strand:+ start:6827 stop:8359 length:1533 start_codon:yes stop_codon:yes gene_type:complete